MLKYKKLIVGALALAMLAVKIVFDFDVPFGAEAAYAVVISILGAFGIYQSSNG